MKINPMSRFFTSIILTLTFNSFSASTNDTIEKFVSKIYRSLEDLGQNEIMSSTIGKFVMDGLKELDHVGYVRFASVYTDFKEAKDFEQFVDNINAQVKK